MIVKSLPIFFQGRHHLFFCGMLLTRLSGVVSAVASITVKGGVGHSLDKLDA